MSVVARISRALEDGSVPRWAIARAAAEAWGKISGGAVTRPLRFPDGVRVVAIGGATLGGSGKTPLAIAVALDEAERSGDEVALIGHGYRASLAEARWVGPDDPVIVVGDEALACARATARSRRGRVRIAVAPRRQAAIDFAVAHGARVLVLDGVAQTSPRRASRALLAVDAADPWGAGALPPLGDLRAPMRALVDACDEIVALRDPLAPPGAAMTSGAGARPLRVVDVSSRGVWHEGALLGWEHVARLRVGLALSVARPQRIVAFLARRGVVPVACSFGADHRAISLSSLATDEVDLWLGTAKCAAHFTSSDGRLQGAAGRAYGTEIAVPFAHIDHLAGRLDPARQGP